MKAEESVDFHLRRTWTSLMRYYNTKAKAESATAAMAMVLLAIPPNGIPSTQIGPKMGIESTSLSRILNLLEEQGMIERNSDIRDKRKSIVFLTSIGKKQRDKSRTEVIQMNQMIREGVGEKKLQSCLNILEQINTILEQQIP
jgi:DNA-binding MarR family transcriptional regulator